LRIREVRQLTVADLDPDATVPHVRLRAAITKNGKADSIPLRSDLFLSLRTRVEGLRSSDRVFDVSVGLIKRFNADCRRAGIAKRDDRGRSVDVHSLRTTFGTYLATAGVGPRLTEQLIRHSDIHLTMQVYTDPMLFDLQGAVESLRSVSPSVSRIEDTNRQPMSSASTPPPFWRRLNPSNSRKDPVFAGYWGSRIRT
jgi:integrase